MNQQELLLGQQERVEENKLNLCEDPFRLQYHLMPPVGLLNDPNGLIQYKGVYHVFYQWNPFATSHGSKFWGHYTSKDLVEWQEHEPALVPSEWYEKNGCYSGSAVESDGKMVIFYTGNVKNDKNERETYQCMAVSDDGFSFQKKGPVIMQPDGFTAHFRDPKVWKQDGCWYMVLGAQTVDEKGSVVLYSSADLLQWEFKGKLAGSGMNGLGDFGYMWECPDLFTLGDKEVLLVSPQGLEAEGYLYHNLFQSGYFIGHLDLENVAYHHGEFTELDRGFDFYAPQTFVDDGGRRILYGWMGITDENESSQPTIGSGWIHSLTLPRELELSQGKLVQKPVAELVKLRKSQDISRDIQLENESCSLSSSGGTASELKICFGQLKTEEVEISIRENVRLIFHPKEYLFTMERKNSRDGKPESRSCELLELHDMHVFIDNSSIEVFLNGGDEVFTARFFAEPDNSSLTVSIKGQAELSIQKWTL